MALARIIAAKPQSADVERLISAYNKIKADGRISIAPEALFKYMHTAICLILLVLIYDQLQRFGLKGSKDASAILPLKLGSKIGLREFLNVLRKYKTTLTKIRTCHLITFLLDIIFAEK